MPAVLLTLIMVAAAACSPAADVPASVAVSDAAISAEPIRPTRDADVPDLPFADNPDPNACGIPMPWHVSQAWVNGVYRDQLIEPTVFLYDSHERLDVVGRVPSGTAVEVQLYQANPVLDLYFVRADTPSGPQKGWVPAPSL
jgi:hypothetical protein